MRGYGLSSQTYLVWTLKVQTLVCALQRKERIIYLSGE